MARRRIPAPRTEQAPPGRVRIVAGKWRGRRLPVADVPNLRPTSDRIRETLFNWLAPRIEGARCLDLYAGTGALGFEALSRGAVHVVFVERAPPAAQAIERAAAVLGAAGARVQAVDALRFLGQGGRELFDVVFLDPPFEEDRLGELCRLLHQKHWLAPGAAVYLEQDRARPAVPLPERWLTLREKAAGNVRYSLVQAGEGAESST